MLTDLKPVEISPQIFRDTMAQLGTAVHIVTTDGPHGRAGFTASAVCSATDSPPSLLVCINRASSAYVATTENAVLCINILSAEQHDVSAAFSSKSSMDGRFEKGDWLDRDGRPPHLAGAIASVDCRIVNRIPVGSHDVMVCEVSEIQSNAHPGALIYFDRKYHRITCESRLGLDNPTRTS
jgi:flavin reductase